MNTKTILAEIDTEIQRLQQVRALINGRSVKNGASIATVKSPSKKHTMSTEGRARIAAAQRARWAKARKPTMLPEGRARVAAGQKPRRAKIKAAAK
jgi:hypothetical protein